MRVIHFNTKPCPVHKHNPSLRQERKLCCIKIRDVIYGYTVKLGYNEHAWDRPTLFVIAVICYNRKDLCTKLTILDLKCLYIRYSREIIKTVIVVTKFYSASFLNDITRLQLPFDWD